MCRAASGVSKRRRHGDTYMGPSDAAPEHVATDFERRMLGRALEVPLRNEPRVRNRIRVLGDTL